MEEAAAMRAKEENADRDISICSIIIGASFTHLCSF